MRGLLNVDLDGEAQVIVAPGSLSQVRFEEIKAFLESQ